MITNAKNLQLVGTVVDDWECIYLFAVTDDNQVNIISLTPASKGCIDSIRVVDVKETTRWLAEEARIILDSLTLGWGIYYAKHLLEVILKQLKVDKHETCREIRPMPLTR